MALLLPGCDSQAARTAGEEDRAGRGADPPGAHAADEPLAKLRARIRTIERVPGRGRGPDPQNTGARAWTLGEELPDSLLGGGGLDPAGVHEIKPALTGDDRPAAQTTKLQPASWAAAHAGARSFALALALRWLLASGQRAPLLWCASRTAAAELGRPYGPGLAALGLAPEHLIVVEAERQADVLWALEEGLRSEGIAIAIGQIDEAGLTPARRLALAAAAASTPCLLLTGSRRPPAAAAASRWRVAPAPSAAHPLDRQAPGAPCLSVVLERCRSRPPSAEAVPLTLEWCHAASRFRMAPRLADRAHAPGAERGRTGTRGHSALHG